MYKIFSKYYIIVGIIILSVFVMHNSLFAAQINFKIVTNTTIAGEATIIEARIDPESKNINVLEGTINLTGLASADLSVEIKNEKSVFTLWPVEPKYNSSEKAIHFVGGVPQGINKEGLLFYLYLYPTVVGELEISWINAKAYLNDGLGTEEPISTKSIVVNLDDQKPDKVSQTYEKTNFHKIKEAVARFIPIKDVIILLSIIIFLSIIFYGYKKFIKK